jgi:hypothetical protein
MRQKHRRAARPTENSPCPPASRFIKLTDLNFEVNITGATVAGDVVFQCGKTDGLGQFPLNGFFSEVLATINNVSVSSPVEDIMPSLLRMCDQKEVSKYNLLTASYLDQNFLTLEGCEAYGSNPLAGLGAVSNDATIMFRGVIVPKSITIEQMTVAVVAVSTCP